MCSSREYYSGCRRSSLFQPALLLFFYLFGAAVLVLPPATLLAAEPGVLQGRILDIDGGPVADGEVYIFDSPNVKRPADFISNRTGPDGSFRVQLPSGNYWGVAVLRRSGARFGPLAYGDKHSGDAAAFELGTGIRRHMDFVVVNLREAARRHKKKSADLVRVTGTIRDSAGRPAVMAYAMAHPMPQFGTLPAFISSWSEAGGSYTLYLEPGRYYLGAALGFPPQDGYNLLAVHQFTGDTAGVDLVLDRGLPRPAAAPPPEAAGLNGSAQE